MAHRRLRCRRLIVLAVFRLSSPHLFEFTAGAARCPHTLRLGPAHQKRGKDDSGLSNYPRNLTIYTAGVITFLVAMDASRGETAKLKKPHPGNMGYVLTFSR